MNSTNDVLFSPEVWRVALERYGSDTRLSVTLFDTEGRAALGPVNPTPLLELFTDHDYEPGIFAECARRCLAQTDSRPAVMVAEICGLAVVGTSLVLDGAVVGAAVGGYALVDFSQTLEIQRLARDAGIAFERVWQVARAQKPVPRHRLLLSGELLQVLGDSLLGENHRARQYERALLELRSHTEELTRFNRAAVGRELRMIQLKQEVNELCRLHGDAERYPLEFEEPDGTFSPPTDDRAPE
jgi:hypothetical protein